MKNAERVEEMIATGNDNLTHDWGTALAAIADILDTTVWEPEMLDQIARIVRDEGFEVRDTEDVVGPILAAARASHLESSADAAGEWAIDAAMAEKLDAEPVGVFVTERLAARGYAATWEYPGYVAIVESTGEWSIGTANGEYWQGHFNEGPTGEVTGVIDLPESKGWTDPVQIADAIEAALRAIEAQHEQTERGE